MKKLEFYKFITVKGVILTLSLFMVFVFLSNIILGIGEQMSASITEISITIEKAPTPSGGGTPPRKEVPADFNSDDKVDAADFSIFLFNWGIPSNLQTDMNRDGIVDAVDLSIFLFYWTG